MRTAFERVREGGLLEDIPGLVYRPEGPEGPPHYLVNTGVQRLVQTSTRCRWRWRPWDRSSPARPQGCPPGRSRPSNSVAMRKSWRWSPPTAASSIAPTVPSPPTTSSLSATAVPRMVEEIAGVADLRHVEILRHRRQLLQSVVRRSKKRLAHGKCGKQDLN